MPGKNGMGPLGQAPASGQGRGFCTGRNLAESVRACRGRGTRRGLESFCRQNETGELKKEISRLERVLSILKRRLDEKKQ